jgi:hypothetical protein
VPKQKLNLFEFPTSQVAQSGTRATPAMGCEILYAGTFRGLSLDKMPRSSEINSFQNIRSMVFCYELNPCLVLCGLWPAHSFDCFAPGRAC